VESEAAAVAPLIGVTEYEARLTLVTPLPAIVQTTSSRDRANDTAALLRARGHGIHVFDEEAFVPSERMTKMDDFRLDADGIRRVADLEGKTLAVGSRDSTQARILPLHFLKQAGVELERVNLLPFDTDLGKHGDTGTSELDVLRALAEGRADAGAVGDLVWVNEQAAGRINPQSLEVLMTTPGFDHCMFDAMPDFDDARAEAFTRALFAMQWENPAHRRLLELEGLRQWLPPREEGYESLRRALDETNGW